MRTCDVSQYLNYRLHFARWQKIVADREVKEIFFTKSLNTMQFLQRLFQYFICTFHLALNLQCKEESLFPNILFKNIHRIFRDQKWLRFDG